MFELLLMRHAKSDWSSHLPDIDRPLNKRGRDDAMRMGAYLNQQGLAPDRMVISVAERTRETARLLLSNLTLEDKNIIFDRQLYLADREALIDVIELYANDNQRLLILAHNPGMDYLVSYLASIIPPLSAILSKNGKLMTTCALAHFSLDSLDALTKPGQAELLNIIRAKGHL
ncbi:histidine phosphatase family protein [Cardiobacterium sp. AH-315-I02]|nr:histidine phosphatase family protein [Cardiobacterium sp. AH-315-I02]